MYLSITLLKIKQMNHSKNHLMPFYNLKNLIYFYVYVFAYLTRKVPLRSKISSPGQDRQQTTHLQRNTHHHNEQHKAQLSKNNTNPNQLIKHVHCSI